MPSDWSRVFAPETPLLELIARGAALYFGILILMRFMLRRSVGDLAGMDLIFIILLAEAAAHSLGDYTTIADGAVLILVLVGSNYLVNFLSYHVPLVERLTSNPPVLVVKDGELLRRNMRREFVTEQELMEHLRQEGIEEIADVREAYIEENGKFTAIRKKDSKQGGRK